MSTSSKIDLMSLDPPTPLQAGQASIARQSLDGGEEREGQALSDDWIIDQAAFNDLLCWLGPDPEVAGQEYERIRRKLITIFICKRCDFPEDMADDTINRVAKKLPQIKSDYIGSPSRYFYGVAKNVYKEYCRRLSLPRPLPAPTANEDWEEWLQYLDYALSRLEQADRELILKYYGGEGRSKIDHRKNMAQQMGLGLNALRLRVYRIKVQLREYLCERYNLTFT